MTCRPHGRSIGDGRRKVVRKMEDFWKIFVRAVALERLQEDAHGNLLYTFTHPGSDGTTGITLSPLERLEKLAALVPLPRVPLVRYGGCLAPHSHRRGAIRP